MLDTNHKNAPCRYAEQIVSHLYGEGEATKKNEFDAHLQNCSFCAEELENFGFVRSSILEWRDQEFSNLATPAFEIPKINSVSSVSVVSNPTVSKSFFGGLKNLFSFKPAFAALTFLIACAAVAFIAINFSGGDKEFAANQTNNSTEKIVSPNNETKENPAETNLTEKKIEKIPTVEIVESPREVKTGKTAMPEKPIVKTANAPAPKINSENTVSSHSATKEKNPKPASIQKQRVPSLNNIEVEEDDSIRLAELFDEIDAK